MAVRTTRTGKARRSAPKPAEKLQSPGKLDFKKANRTVAQVIRENQAWLKEMAKR